MVENAVTCRDIANIESKIMLAPLPASTVVVCRITKKWPYKILVLKRSQSAKFLPGAHVFPGGQVEPKDEILGELLATDIYNFRRMTQYFPRDKKTVARHLAAAIRETYEETTLSILRVNSSQPCASSTLAEMLQNPQHQALNAELNNVRGVFKDPLRPCLDNIWPISWWITPLGEVRRFDTWFFLSLIDDSPKLDAMTGVITSDEGYDLRWISPKDALVAYQNRDMFLAPPTRSIMERMACTVSLEEFLSFVDCPLSPIEPFFAVDGGEKVLILPGDPLHPQKKRPAMPVATRYAFP